MLIFAEPAPVDPADVLSAHAPPTEVKEEELVILKRELDNEPGDVAVHLMQQALSARRGIRAGVPRDGALEFRRAVLGAVRGPDVDGRDLRLYSRVRGRHVRVSSRDVVRKLKVV